MFFIVILFLVVLGVCLMYLLGRLGRKDAINLPPEFPGSLPLIGHAHMLIGDTAHLWRFVKKVQEHNLDNGGVTHMKIGTKIFYAVSDPDDCTTLCNVCLEKNSFYTNIISTWIGNGLVTAPVSIWKSHRKLINPAFKQQVLEGFLGIMNSHARLLVDNFAAEVGKGPFDPIGYLDRTILEASFRIAFGAARIEKNIAMESYLKAFKDSTFIILQRFQHIWMHSEFLYGFTNLKKKQDIAFGITSAVSDEIIQEKKSGKSPKDLMGATTDGKFKGFVDILLELAGDKMSDEDIRGELDTIIFAGYDSSATSVALVLTLLGSYPEVQERAYAEVREVLGDNDRDLEKDDLLKLVYLEAVIKETLRVFPIVPVVIRELDKDVQLKNFTLKAGNDCMIFIYAMQRHPVWGEDREQFKPERWLNPSTLPENQNSFGVFGVGRRACIGKPYALMSIKTILVHILTHYKVKGDSKKLDMKLEILTKPIAGHHITLEKRK